MEYLSIPFRSCLPFFTLHIIFADYTTFLVIPAGTKNIQLKELRSSSSFIAIKSQTQYYLNGDWSMDWPGNFEFAGAKFVYNRLYSGLETIYSTGTTNETLEIQVSLIDHHLCLSNFIYNFIIILY